MPKRGSPAEPSLTTSDPSLTSEPSLTTQAVWLGRWFTGARREGFLALLTPPAWHTLCAVLSFTTREGRRVFSLDQLAATLGASRDEARRRLTLLSEEQWHGAPLLTLHQAPDGEIQGALLLPVELFALVQPPPPGAVSAAVASGPSTAPAPAAANPAAANPAAATPTAAASDEAAPAEPAPDGVPNPLPPALARVGLNSFQIDWLLRTYPVSRIQRQLHWLPAREAHNPPALLIRAIEQDWEAPKDLPKVPLKETPEEPRKEAQ